MVKVTFLDYGAGNIRSLRNALVKVGAPSTQCRPPFACVRLALQSSCARFRHPPLSTCHLITTCALTRGSNLLLESRMVQVGCDIMDVEKPEDIADAQILIFPGAYARHPRTHDRPRLEGRMSESACST